MVTDQTPYSFHRRSTNSFVFSIHLQLLRPAPHLPSAGSLTVASKPILLPAPSPGLAWSRISTGPWTISRVALRIAIAEEVKQHILLVVHIHVLVHDDDELGEAICPAPQIACITRRAWNGYSLRILTNAQLWNTPLIGRQ